MHLSVILIACLLAALCAAKRCNDKDAAIYRDRGHEFPSLFRSFGGYFVKQPAFEHAIVNAVHLTRSCASCYGNAYTCGKDKCFWTCSSAGKSCDECLKKEHCTSSLHTCTGWAS